MGSNQRRLFGPKFGLINLGDFSSEFGQGQAVILRKKLPDITAIMWTQDLASLFNCVCIQDHNLV